MNGKTDVAGTVQLDAQLTVTHFDTGEPRHVDIHYRVDNVSSLPIAVLNIAALNADDPPQPAFAVTARGDLTVAYHLDAPRRADLAVPQNVYAMRVLPGEHFERSVSIKLLAAYPDRENISQLVRPKRVRVCQGYAIHSPDRFTKLENKRDVWLAQPGIFSSQERLCSQWTDLRDRVGDG